MPADKVILFWRDSWWVFVQRGGATCVKPINYGLDWSDRRVLIEAQEEFDTFNVIIDYKKKI